MFMKLKDMNPEAKVVLKKILATGIKRLKGHEIAFLRARQSYLSKGQKKKFEKVLKGSLKPKKPVRVKDIPYKELQRKAKSLGYPHVGVKREDLEVAVSTTLGPEYPRYKEEAKK